jgi:hypothetical protein
MPASTYAELFQFEDVLLPQYAAVLTAAGVTNHHTRETGNLTTPRVALEIKMGGTNDHAAVVYGGATMFDQWRFTLTATVVTGRNQNNSTHQTYLGKVRYLLLAPSTSATINAALPYHSVIKALAAEDPTSIDVVKEEDQDVTVLQFSGVVQIDPAAWPQSAP